MFPLLIYTLQKAVWLMKSDAPSSSLIKAIGRVATIPHSVFYSEVSKPAQSNEAYILSPTFPAGQIEKNEAGEPASLCDLLTIPCGVVLTEKHAHQVPPNYISHSRHERRLWSAELLSVSCSVQAPATSHPCSPALGLSPHHLCAGSFPIHPSPTS